MARRTAEAATLVRREVGEQVARAGLAAPAAPVPLPRAPRLAALAYALAVAMAVALSGVVAALVLARIVA